jgi:L-lysine exporter family protein LysE/ArgO
VSPLEQLITAGNGVLFGLALIVAIGPQNMFVLRQGLLRHNVGAIVAVCVLSDVLLITLGAVGVGGALEARPMLANVLRYTGAAFLTAYAAFAVNRALQSQSFALTSVPAPTLMASVSACLAFTFLNPHVYLDTVVLLGVIASAHGENAMWFTVGAMTASCVWFTALGYGSRLLRPLFVKPSATRALDIGIAGVMLCIAASLVTNGV